MSIKLLIENELAKAESVLATKDLVDRLQKALEDVNKMRIEDLPDLAETLQNSFDQSAVQSFVDSVNSSMESLISNLEQARDSVDQASKSLTGQDGGVATPSMLGGDKEAGDLDMDMDMDSKDDAFAMTPPAAGGDNLTGRETRESFRDRRASLVERAKNLSVKLEAIKKAKKAKMASC
jgi:hypothetical protein